MQAYSSPLAHVRLFENALPGKLHERLLRAFIAIGDERPDGKDTYSRTFWYERGCGATNLAEEAIEELQKCANPPSDCIGTEWWVGRLRYGKKLALHFDRDLSHSQATGQLVHPVLSSVYYLNRFDSSPTLLLDQIPGDDGRSKVPHTARLSTSVAAIANNYVVFPGNLRHGVIPDRNKLQRDSTSDSRLTLLVNYWDKRPSAPVCRNYDGSVYRTLCYPQ